MKSELVKVLFTVYCDGRCSSDDQQYFHTLLEKGYVIGTTSNCELSSKGREKVLDIIPSSGF